MATADPDDLQFTKLELDQPSDSDLRCSVLGTEITGDYYLVNGRVHSPEAKEGIAEASGAASGGAARFSKAVLYGAVAAALGSLLYFLVSWITGYELGLISIIVGIGVGKAVFIGSGSRGGRKYQVLAVLLTYTSIVSSYVPLVFMELSEEQTEQAEAVAGEGGTPTVVEGGAEPAAQGAIAETEEQEEPAELTLLDGAFLVGLLFALPFLSAFENLLGLAIIAFGLWEAWKLTARSEFVIEGPFTVQTSSAQETP